MSSRKFSCFIILPIYIPYLYLYITKSWSIVFNVATLRLSHINYHIITILFPEFVIQFKISFLKFKNTYKKKIIPNPFCSIVTILDGNPLCFTVTILNSNPLCSTVTIKWKPFSFLRPDFGFIAPLSLPLLTLY